jgi:hypothetical protein
LGLPHGFDEIEVAADGGQHFFWYVVAILDEPPSKHRQVLRRCGLGYAANTDCTGAAGCIVSFEMFDRLPEPGLADRTESWRCGNLGVGCQTQGTAEAEPSAICRG